MLYKMNDRIQSNGSAPVIDTNIKAERQEWLLLAIVTKQKGPTRRYPPTLTAYCGVPCSRSVRCCS